ncbi:hypothetical protein JTB14_017771 [Gonioctena quinquepunctata]|nr:hypothetical protein JTB14_017771 [Gonioctena quinquepunctata]
MVEKKRVVFRNKELLLSDASESDIEVDDDDHKKKKRITSNNINPSVKKIFENNILKKYQSALPKDRNSISELTCEIEKMKIIQREQEQQIKELTKLNIELQRDVININRALVEKIEKMVGGGSLKKDNVEIGTVVDDEVHLGQNVFIKKGSYDTAYVTARSGTQFVKNIAMAVFGALTLKNSSVTGKSSNNIKKEICRPALCATKLSAIHDIYAFFLNNRGYSKLEIERELKHVNNYLASKISDLNRLPRVKRRILLWILLAMRRFQMIKLS